MWLTLPLGLTRSHQHLCSKFIESTSLRVLAILRLHFTSWTCLPPDASCFWCPTCFSQIDVDTLTHKCCSKTIIDWKCCACSESRDRLGHNRDNYGILLHRMLSDLVRLLVEDFRLHDFWYVISDVASSFQLNSSFWRSRSVPDGTVLGCNRRCNREKSSSRLSNEIWSHAFGEVNEKFPWTSALHFQTQPDNQCSVSVTGDNCEGNLCLLPALKCLPTPSIQSKNESYCTNTPVVKVCTSRVIARIHVISRAMPIVPAKQKSYHAPIRPVTNVQVLLYVSGF